MAIEHAQDAAIIQVPCNCQLIARAGDTHAGRACQSCVTDPTAVALQQMPAACPTAVSRLRYVCLKLLSLYLCTLRECNKNAMMCSGYSSSDTQPLHLIPLHQACSF